MAKIQFPSEASKLAAFEAKISEDLTLHQMEEMADKIVAVMTEKTQGVAMQLLGQLEEKKEVRLHREIALLEADQHPLSRIEKLKPLIFFLSPEQIQEQFEAIEMHVSLYNDQDHRMAQSAERELELLRFREEFRVVDELFGQAPLDFSVQMRGIEEQIQSSHSLELLQNLSKVQIQEVYRASGGIALSPEGMAHSIEQYLDALCAQASVAEAFYHGRLEEGFAGLLALPEDVRLKIDQLIWEAAGGEAIDPTEEGSSALITAAILHNLEERMGA